MIRRHVTQHGSSPEGDALDVLARQDELLRSLFANWNATAPDQRSTDAVTAAWDHGTVAKLLLEHGVVRLAAQEDLVAALRRAGQHQRADQVGAHTDEARQLLRRLSEVSRGVQPINLHFEPAFVPSVERLAELWRRELASGVTSDTAGLAEVLGAERASLRSARYLRKHAPTRPSRDRRGDRPAISRVRTVIDRVRGWPWAESDVSDAALAERYDREKR